MRSSGDGKLGKGPGPGMWELQSPTLNLLLSLSTAELSLCPCQAEPRGWSTEPPGRCCCPADRNDAPC